jgi:hypothetical protein
MKMEMIQCCKTSAYKIQTPENYPKDNILHPQHGESLKTTQLFLPLLFLTLFTFAFQAHFTGFYFLLLHDVTPLHAIYVITSTLILKLQHFSLLRDYKSYSTVLPTL